MAMATMGSDVAKRIFQAHGGDVQSRTVRRRKPQRAEVLAFP